MRVDTIDENVLSSNTGALSSDRVVLPKALQEIANDMAGIGTSESASQSNTVNHKPKRLKPRN